MYFENFVSSDFDLYVCVVLEIFISLSPKVIKKHELCKCNNNNNNILLLPPNMVN